MFTKSSSPCRIAIVLPASDGAGGAPAWSVSQNFASRWLREFSAISTSSSWVRSAIVGGVPGRPGDQAERRQDAAGLGQRLGHLVVGLGVAHQRRAGRHLHRAVGADVGGADHDRRVRGRCAVLVAADQREGTGVVAATLGLVLVDQPAGVLHRCAGDGGGEHRVAQHVAYVGPGAAGEEVLGVHQMGHRLEERPEHLAALVADVAHHLQLLVDHHEELEDLLLVGEELQQPVFRSGSTSVLHRGGPVVEAAQPEGAGDRVHPHVAAVHADVPLRRGADQEPVAGPEAVGPVGAALAGQQPAEHGQRLRRCPSRAAARGSAGRRRGWRPRRCRSRRG